MSLEAAGQALDQALSQQSSAPEAPVSTTEQPNTQDSVPELDKFERFKWEGKEWTPKDLKQMTMFQSDYTRKTQEVAQERKYYDNLAADLEAVSKDPSLAAKFKELYPAKFHSYLKYLSQNQSSAQTQPVAANQAQDQSFIESLKKEIAELREQLNPLKEGFEQQELAKTEAQLDSIYNEFSKKYEMADERTVTATAQALHGQGTELSKDLWERIFKEDHERNLKRYEQHYSKQVKQQKEASAKARDVAAGGGVPGQAPKRLSMKDATEAAIRDLSAR